MGTSSPIGILFAMDPTAPVKNEDGTHSADGTTVNTVAIPIFKVLVVYIVITKDRVK